ncbi:TonB-dependent receptor [Lewinella sp. IMCC34183]|uniref:TonB-dependent receptor n=1 Tax=Lewinella sp. IMCC34183 TaxID=2248762 RepID=UPI0018E5170B|nr:TonB-dependent receptor [Lewinella sp. IMCC34183]
MGNRLLFSLLAFLIVGGLIGQVTVTGRIVDAGTGEPLIGATVLGLGSLAGTTTDVDGSFVLEVAGTFPASVVVTYIGYANLEVAVPTGQPLEISLAPAPAALDQVVVSARRRNEEAQDIPLPVAVLGAAELDNSVSFNVNRVKELVPSVQLYSSNPRNTTLNIRGLGSTYGLTNDGIDPGVGFYVDGVYYARPAAATLDFIDVQQIEVLRGPQGTLFGKNTTAGTFNVTSRAPSFTTTAIFEQSFGNLGFIQTKGSVSGPLVPDRLAARLSFTGTHREGTLYNARTHAYTNTLSNQGARAQLLYTPREGLRLRLYADVSRQRPDGYAQVFAGTFPTRQPADRQFAAIAADLGYAPPSLDPFDRVIDHDTPWRSDQDMGGVSLTAELDRGNGVLTATSAWRTWHWNPSNDRDFTGLSAIARSQAPSVHQQWSQEVHYAGPLTERVEGLIGAFVFYQRLDPKGAHVLEAGADQWRFVQRDNNPLWQTPGLLDGLTQETRPHYRNLSGALFSQLTWQVTDRLSLLPGLRLNYDQKRIDFAQTVRGGLSTEDPALLALQGQVFRPLAFAVNTDDWNVSGQLSLQYRWNERMRTYGIYSLGFKPVGLNLGGIPVVEGRPRSELAVVAPERVNHFEAGIKSEPLPRATLNVTAYVTRIDDYQTNVSSSQLGVVRGYLANAERVRVRGVEVESGYRRADRYRLTASVSYTDGVYVSFPDAPVPPEEVGGAEFKDISGERLPGISRWTGSGGGEYYLPGHLIGQTGQYFAGLDAYARSEFSSNPSASRYLNVEGYVLVNARLGFRMVDGITLFAWARNLTDTNYYEQLLPAAGNAGYYAAVLGDPATFGITLRYGSF